MKLTRTFQISSITFDASDHPIQVRFEHSTIDNPNMSFDRHSPLRLGLTFSESSPGKEIECEFQSCEKAYLKEGAERSELLIVEFAGNEQYIQRGPGAAKNSFNDNYSISLRTKYAGDETKIGFPDYIFNFSITKQEYRKCFRSIGAHEGFIVSFKIKK